MRNSRQNLVGVCIISWPGLICRRKIPVAFVEETDDPLLCQFKFVITVVKMV
jgi:hypothetical protein